MNDWERTFVFQGKNLSYNRIQYNNPSERSVEVSIGFEFLAHVKNSARVIEVGNVLSYYENSLSERVGVSNRRIIDKFEIDIGIDNEDLMSLPSAEKYDSIVSISTVEHIGQGVDPSGAYGELTNGLDREAPLKAIAKIYDLLAVDGKALITVPFGILTDGGWYIQFSGQYLALLKKYGIPQEAICTKFLKLINKDPTKHSVKMLWKEVDEIELRNVEYNHPFPCANAIAVIELSKLSNDFHLNLNNVEPTPLNYYMPYETRIELSQYKVQLKQIQDEQTQLQLQLQQTHRDLDQSYVLLHQAESGLAQSQAQLHQTQEEFEQSQAQLHQTQEEFEQSQAQLHQTQEEFEQSQAQLHQTQGELERLLKVPPALHAQADVQSQTQYKLLLWEGWYAYHRGDLKRTVHFLKESLNCTPLSPTETVLDWLEKFSQFSSEKGVHLDTNSLINSAEWKELIRHSLNGKLSVAVR